MAVTSKSETAECSHCGGERDQFDSIRGGYCSLECYYRDKGESVINHVEQDHRWCATCFRPIKTIERPPDSFEDRESPVQAALNAGATMANEGGTLVLDVTDAADQRRMAAESVIGYQYPTENMVRAIDERDTESGMRTLFSRWGCECGAVNPSQRDDVLEAANLRDVIVQLHWCLQSLYDDGQISTRPDREALFDALREEWRDWPYAIGKAVDGG